ncbi:hypothetical protein BGZ80_000823, partial [Entomortierella chlamydospora]
TILVCTTRTQKTWTSYGKEYRKYGPMFKMNSSRSYMPVCPSACRCFTNVKELLSTI